MEPALTPLTRFAAGDAVARWRLLAALWSAGAVMGLLAGLLADVPGVATTGAVALGLSALVAALAPQVDVRLLGPVLALGATIITLALIAAGAIGVPLLVLHVWVAGAAWCCVPAAAAVALSAYAVALGGVTVAALPDAGPDATLLWALTATTVVVVGGLMAALRVRADGLERQLRELVDRDELTGALNRRGLGARVAGALARQRRTAEAVALVRCDLDRFRTVNDQFGNTATDELLRRFAACCDAELRATDVVARIEGERFALLLPDADPKAAALVAERIRSRIGRELRAPDNVPLTASFGVAGAPAHAADADALLAAADAALLAAQRAGRDLVLRAGTVWPAGG